MRTDFATMLPKQTGEDSAKGRNPCGVSRVCFVTLRMAGEKYILYLDAKHPASRPRYWNKVSMLVPNKTADQCMTR